MRWRTNVTLLAVSASVTLVGAFLVSYGGAKVIGPYSLIWDPMFPLVALSPIVTGVGLYVLKDLHGRRWMRLLLASPLMSVIASGAALAVYYRSAAAAVLFPAFFAALFSMWNEEPTYGEPSRKLLPLVSATVLALSGLLQLTFQGEVLGPRPLFVAYVASLVGALALYVQSRRPDSSEARVLRWVVAGGLLASSALFLVDRQPILAILFAPFGLLSAFREQWLDTFNLGMSLPPGLSEENRVVRTFEQVAKLAAWAVYAYASLHLYFSPLGIQWVIFTLFVVSFSVFVAQYDSLPLRYSTYEKYMRESLMNAVLLAAISHFTGGLQSPFAWFFVLILIGGSVGTDPRHILNRLTLIMTYFALETFDTLRYGGLNEAVIVDGLLLRVVVTGIAGAYAYRLSARRQEIEDALRGKTLELTAALKTAEQATELAVRRGQEIEAAKKRDEAIMASLADAVVAVGTDRKILFLNLAAERFTGIRRAEATGLSIAGVLPFAGAAVDLEGLLTAVFNGNALPLPDDSYLAGTDGKGKIYVAGAIVPIFGIGGRVEAAALTFRDVTYLREVDQMKTGFLSVAAHQLRTPLSTIRWYLELLNDPEEGKLKQNQKLFAGNAYQSLRKMINLVNRLLAVTRLESGRVPVKPVMTDLGALTEDILKGLEVKLKDRKLEMRLNVQGKPPMIPLDQTLAREVFLNLIENAIRYTPDGGAVVIDLALEGRSLHWSVKDSGIGIPKDQQEKIFEKFYRASNAVVHAADGNGLGLYLAKFIVGTWKGDMTFVSKEGEGTTFHVTVPLEGMLAKTGEVSLNA